VNTFRYARPLRRHGFAQVSKIDLLLTAAMKVQEYQRPLNPGRLRYVAWLTASSFAHGSYRRRPEGSDSYDRRSVFPPAATFCGGRTHLDEPRAGCRIIHVAAYDLESGWGHPFRGVVAL